MSSNSTRVSVTKCKRKRVCLVDVYQIIKAETTCFRYLLEHVFEVATKVFDFLVHN